MSTRSTISSFLKPKTKMLSVKGKGWLWKSEIYKKEELKGPSPITIEITFLRRVWYFKSLVYLIKNIISWQNSNKAKRKPRKKRTEYRTKVKKIPHRVKLILTLTVQTKSSSTSKMSNLWIWRRNGWGMPMKFFRNLIRKCRSWKKKKKSWRKGFKSLRKMSIVLG